MPDNTQLQNDDSEQTLKQAIRDSNEVLVSASTVLSLRPNTLTLNRTKLAAERRSGLNMVTVISVRIEDVLNVNGSAGPLFGSLQIMTKFTKPGEPFTMGPFRRKDVLKLKRIIQGCVIAIEKGIDLDPIPTEELKSLLYQLGEDDHTIQ